MKHCYIAGSHPDSVWFHRGAITVDPYTVGRWAVYGPWTSDAEYVGTKEKCLEYASKRTEALEA